MLAAARALCFRLLSARCWPCLVGRGEAVARWHVSRPVQLSHCCCFLVPLQGLLLIGPTLHVWYGSLGTIVKATGNTGALMRLGLDQLCFAPIFISSEQCWELMELDFKAKIVWTSSALHLCSSPVSASDVCALQELPRSKCAAQAPLPLFGVGWL